jgi:hypothetical protein
VVVAESRQQGSDLSQGHRPVGVQLAADDQHRRLEIPDESFRRKFRNSGSAEESDFQLRDFPPAVFQEAVDPGKLFALFT